MNEAAKKEVGKLLPLRGLQGARHCQLILQELGGQDQLTLLDEQRCNPCRRCRASTDEI